MAGAEGRIFAVWLDHREMAEHTMGAAAEATRPPGTGAAAPDADAGVAMAQKSKLCAGTLDGSIAPHAVTGGVCYCCKTALAIAPDGAVYAAWRHVYPGNLRDIAFSVSRGGRNFSAPVRVGRDQCAIEGCPDDGPAMAIDRENRVHIAWPTLVTDAPGEPTIAVFYSSSSDGRTFAPRVRVPTRGVAHHPQIVIGADGTPTLAWDENVGGSRQLVAATAPSFKRRVVSGAAPGVYPSLAVAGRQVVAAWTSAASSGSVVRVDRLRP